MTVTDPGKLLLLGIALVGGFALILTDRSSEAGAGIILYVLGYLTGNGRLAIKGAPPSPAIGAPFGGTLTSDEAHAMKRLAVAAERVAAAEDAAPS